MSDTATRHTVYRGDARAMSKVTDRSVHLIVTSPPYWQLKDYGTHDQIGFDDSYEEYINNLNRVWMECHRVLHDGCRLCINIGDQFARSAYYGRYKVIPIRTEITRFCETIGFDFMGSVIWQKVTTCNTSGGGTVMGSFPYPRNGIVKIDYEFILLFKKQGDAPKPSSEAKELSRLSNDEWNSYFSGHWTFAGEKQDGHIAMFPEELPHRLIRMFSFAGETVLDPFLGSGTTSRAAKNLGRHSIGYEINPEFQAIIAQKLGDTAEVTFLPDTATEPTKPLPYQFVDPHRLDKQVDVKALRYGSRINSHDPARDNLPRVKEILSPTRLRLSDDRVIDLAGIKTSPERADSAVEYLQEKVKGEKVLVKQDDLGTGSDSKVYLYLKNRTFVNAHLIKQGFAELDDNYTGSNRALLRLSGQHVR